MLLIRAEMLRHDRIIGVLLIIFIIFIIYARRCQIKGQRQEDRAASWSGITHGR